MSLFNTTTVQLLTVIHRLAKLPFEPQAACMDHHWATEK